MTGRRKLLLADDSPTIRKVISLTFADEGMEVVSAADGREALRLLEDEPPPDILLADVVMPGPDGYELCERVKRDGRLRHVAVVLLVGTFEPFNEAEARRVGADAVLTKPFQSIRDLVNKVGSLLGGETKQEADERGAAREEAGHRELAAEVQTRRAEAPGEGSAPAAREASEQEEPAAPFPDLGADDELIEATPADSYRAAASAHGGAAPAPQPAETSFSDLDEPLAGEPVRGPRGAATAPSFGDALRETPRASLNLGGTPPGARPSFEAQATSAAAADDALLDLGQSDLPAADSAAAADEFILDLDDDFPGLSAQAPPAASGPASPLAFDDLGDARPDAPSALAEAAHGGTAAGSFDLFESSPSASADEAARTPFEFSSVPAEAEAHDPALAREVIAQDVAPAETDDYDTLITASPVSGGEARAGAGLAKEFIEPRVVPAAEPTPATIEGEFTDGSVEGDLPKPPAFLPDAPAPPKPFAPEAPSTAGFAVGEARTGVEERGESPVRGESAAQLSPETVEAIARRVVELMSDKVVREIAWEVVPDLAELLIRQRLDEERKKSRD